MCISSWAEEDLGLWFNPILKKKKKKVENEEVGISHSSIYFHAAPDFNTQAAHEASPINQLSMPVCVYHYFLFLEGVQERGLTRVLLPFSLPQSEGRKMRMGVEEDRKVILDDDFRALARFLRQRQLYRVDVT